MARAFIMQIDSSLCGCWGDGEAHVTDCLIGISKKFQTSCLRLRFWQRWTQQSGQVLSLGLASWALTHAMPFRACGCLGNALYEQQTWQPRHASLPPGSRGLPFPRAIVSTYAWDPILSHLPKNVSKFIASFFFIFRFNPSCQHVNMFWSFPLKKKIFWLFLQPFEGCPGFYTQTSDSFLCSRPLFYHTPFAPTHSQSDLEPHDFTKTALKPTEIFAIKISAHPSAFISIDLTQLTIFPTVCVTHHHHHSWFYTYFSDHSFSAPFSGCFICFLI